MPFLSSIASGSVRGYGFGFALAASAAPTNSYFPIASYTVPSGGVSSITFGGLPQTFTNLQIRVLLKSTYTSDNRAAFCVRFNGDTTSSYNTHNLIAEGSGTPTAGSSGTNTFMFGSPNSEFPASGSGVSSASIFGAAVIDLLDYTNVNKFKTAKFLGGWDNNGATGRITFESGLYRSLNAITSINFYTDNGNWAEFSNISIYGVN